MVAVLSGLDVLCADPSLSGLAGGSIGLLSNAASQTGDGRTALRALREAGFKVDTLFAPEHGYFGLGAAGESIADETLVGVPIYSLYGSLASSGHQATTDQLRGLDAVFVDLQDLGVRWYTYLGTIRQLLKICAQAGLRVVLLDRPNPVGGTVVEGLCAEPAYFSLVAAGPFPIRHGLTIGEASIWLNRQAEPAERALLTVIPLHGWSRSMLYSDFDSLWNAPSPNMPTSETGLAYIGTCLVEGTNLSEGRGTALPFMQIGAPYIAQPEALADALNEAGLPGIVWRPAWFRPTTSKYAGERCAGVRLFITDPHAVRGFTAGVTLISTIRSQYPEDFDWAGWSAKNAFDTLAGGRRLRDQIEQGQPAAEIVALADREATEFQAQSADVRLYHG